MKLKGKMLISKKTKSLVFRYLFDEGVIVVKKELKGQHGSKLDVPNLHVMKLMQSLESKGFVRSTFNWRHYYYYLTNPGIESLREFLGLPAEVVPATLKQKRAVGDTIRGGRRGDDERGGFRRDSDRESYRRRGDGDGERRPFGRGRGGFGGRGGFRGRRDDGGMRGGRVPMGAPAEAAPM